MMISYFIKSTSCLALLLLFYHLVLEKEKIHQFNRFYLLGSILFSFLSPIFIIYTKIPIDKFKKTSNFFTSEIIETTDNTTNYISYFLILSVFVSGILLIRFVKNIINIYQKIKTYENVNYKKAVLVLVDENITPHSFWNYIFINKKEYYTNKIEDELFTHELTHVTQKHTFDILIIESLKIIFWFNPILYILKKTIQLNHEFLADTKVITNHKNISEYQYLLLNKATSDTEYYLASNLNYLLTKKRLLMMTKQSSKTKTLIKKLAIIPVIAGLTLLFAQKIEAEESKENTFLSLKNNLLINVIQKLDTLPPPPPKTCSNNKNETAIYYVNNDKTTHYYNKNGQKIGREGKILNKKSNFPKVKEGHISNIPKPINKKITKQSKPKYYLDGKLISKKNADLINPKNIKSVNVKKDEKNGGSIYIISK